MNSRPECGFCGSAVTMGSCSCGRNIFTWLTPEEREYITRREKEGASTQTATKELSNKRRK